MSEKKTAEQMRSLFPKVRRVAAQFAERCDFITAGRIKSAEASCTWADAFVCVEYRDSVERAQIITAFVYASELAGLNFTCNRDEDIVQESTRTAIVSIVLGRTAEPLGNQNTAHLIEKTHRELTALKRQGKGGR